MIVTSSRSAAITYKEQLDKLESPECTVIISGDHNDEEKFWEYTDGTKQKKQIEDFKKPLGTGKDRSNLSILIVKDMLLTGFDAPIAQVMYLDRKITDHNLLQAIARVNRTNKNKFSGYIVDYFGLSDYLSEALEMFSSEDVEGALKDLKDEIPRLKNAHTRVMKHFKGMDLNDEEPCIISLKDEEKRQVFHVDFQRFSKQMDIVLPDPSANPFLFDLKRLGKIAIRARNIYHDEQLDILGAGEKVRQLIEEHVYSTGVDRKIPPVDLLANDFKDEVDKNKTSQVKAYEIESAIKHHIKINLEEDPEYYKSLSERLNEIIRENEEKWEELVQLLFVFRENIESERKERAEDLGLTETEYAFRNILVAEITKKAGGETLNEETHEKVKIVVQSLVKMMDESSKIVGFFDKWDEVKRVKKDIKRTVIEEFDDLDLVKPVTDRFMELAEVKFR
jgi:type I restriction enzyme R subunit